MKSIYQGTPGLLQFQIFNGASFYQTAETGYNVQQELSSGGFAKSSWYGQPYSYQAPRTVRLGVHFDF